MVKNNMKTPSERLHELVSRAKDYAESNQLRMVAAYQQSTDSPLDKVAVLLDEDPLFCAGVLQILANQPEVQDALNGLLKKQSDDEVPQIICQDWHNGGLS